MSTSREQLAEIIGEKTMSITNTEKLARAVAAYIATESKPIDLASLTRDVMQYRLEHGVVEATVVSAHELNAIVIKDVKGLLKEHFPSAKKFIIDSRIDESLVGGIRIELPRETLDLTVRSKLNRFKRLVAEENY